jgi:hypothetical protein
MKVPQAHPAATLAAVAMLAFAAGAAASELADGGIQPALRL